MRTLFVIVAIICSACSGTTTPLPKGPPPEYEQDPVVEAPADAAVQTPSEKK